MQIRNDYTSYQGLDSNRHNHNHHVTDCFYEEVARKTESGAGGQISYSAQPEEKRAENPQNVHMALYSAAAGESRNTKKTSWARQFWDYLGDDTNAEGKGMKPSFSIRQTVMNGISSAAAAFHEVFPYRIVNKWVEVRKSIRTHATAILKKFGKNGEAFTALADERMPSGKRERQHRKEQQKEQIITRRGAVEVSIQQPVHNHLMDSYSKNGEYCQLNEHLSYRRPVSNRNNASTTGGRL